MNYSVEVILNVVAPVVTGAVISLVALGLGAFLSQPFFPGKRPPLVESFALGTLAISLLTFLWYFLAWMGPSARWSLAFPVMLLGAAGWIWPSLSTPIRIQSFRNRTVLVLMVLLVVSSVFRALYQGLYPPYGREECSTYIPSALSLLTSGRMVFDPSIPYSGMPQNTEMLYSWALISKPFSNAHYVNVAAYLVSLLAVIRLGRALYSVKTGWLAALILGSASAFHWYGCRSYPDLWVAFYLLAALLSGVEAYREGSPSRLLLAGIFMGAAAGCAYTGLIGALSLSISLFALGRWRMPEAKPMQREDLFAAILACLAVAAPWYLRNIAWFHNPFFPFLSNVFHAGEGTYGFYAPECTVSLAEIMADHTAAAYFNQGSLERVLIGMWPVWAAVPAGLLFWNSSPFARLSVTWTVLAWGYWLIAGHGVIETGFLLFLAPVTAVLCAHLARTIYVALPADDRGRFARIVLWALLAGWTGAITMRGEDVSPPLTAEEQDSFLSSRLESYDLIRTADSIVPDTSTALGIYCGDSRLYADFTFLGGSDVGLANHRIVAKSSLSPELLAALMHGRYGAKFLIVNEKALEAAAVPAYESIRNVISSPAFTQTFSEVARIGSGAVYFLETPHRLEPQLAPEFDSSSN